MNNAGPSAALQTVGITHLYVLCTLPVSLDGEDKMPLLLTDKAGVFTRDGSKVGIYSPEEREAALLHHRSFMKRENAVITVDGQDYTFKKSETDREDLKQIHDGSLEIFLMNNYSLSRFAALNEWNDGELIASIFTLYGVAERIQAKLSDIYQKSAATGEEVISPAVLQREKINVKTKDFVMEVWMYITGVVVPEIVKDIQDGRIDVLAAVDKLTKGESL